MSLIARQIKNPSLHFQGAKIDATDKHGITPVLAAIWEGHTACVKYLLENVRLVIRCHICNS